MMWLWDILYPPTCIHCGKDVHHHGDWCPTCLESVIHERQIKGPNNSGLDTIFILADYRGGMKTMLHDIKFNGKKERARGAAPFLQRFKDTCLSMGYVPDLVVPIPISESKRRTRGYNQVDILFKTWACHLGWTWNDLLIKLDGSKPMWTLSKLERQENMKGQFIVKRESMNLKQYEGASILLVDDIYTTGATLLAASNVLQKEIPNITIKALTLASGA